MPWSLKPTKLSHPKSKLPCTCEVQPLPTVSAANTLSNPLPESVDLLRKRNTLHPKEKSGDVSCGGDIDRNRSSSHKLRFRKSKKAKCEDNKKESDSPENPTKSEEKMLSPAQDECFSNLSQDFLVCTTIHKARFLGVFTNDIYVRVCLDKAVKNTRVISNSESPYFNEYFVFELKCTLTELLRLTILYEVKKRSTVKKDATIGELLIDLQSAWNQPNRSFFKKWGRLESPIGSSSQSESDGKGYLQIDLAIISQTINMNVLIYPYERRNILGINKCQVNQDYDNIEKNMLQNIEPNVQCNISYNVVFYRGYFAKKSEYAVQFRFHPFKCKTPSSKSTMQPEWNRQISFAWVFPSLSQTFLIQLLAHENFHWKTIAEHELHFDEIAFKDKPFLGPTFVHLYDSVNTATYIGRILLEIRSECLTEDRARELTQTTVPAIDEKSWWQEQEFVFEFLALQGDFVHGNASNCKLSLKLGDLTSNNVECFLKAYPKSAAPDLKYFRQDAPFKAVVLRGTLPDNRHKYDSDYFLQDVVEYMKTEIETFKLFQLKYTNQFQMQVKCLKAIIICINNKIREGIHSKRLEYSGFKDPTPWDTNRLLYLQDVMTKVPEELRGMRSRLKAASYATSESVIEEILQELVRRSNELSSILAKTRLQDEWPELIIVLTMGGKETAHCRLNAKYFMHPLKDKEENPNGLCWRLRNFVFKGVHCPHTCVNCGCNVAIIQGCLGVVVDNERNDYLSTVAKEWKQTETFYWNPIVPYTLFKCRIFIHQAKIRPSSDRSGLCDAHVRVLFGGQAAQTPTEPATLSPIWNAVICFDGISLPGSLSWYYQNPPLVPVEFYDKNSYLGNGLVSVSVISSERADAAAREEPEPPAQQHGMWDDFGNMVKARNALMKLQQLKNVSPPPLKWVSIAVNGVIRAEVLMSAELVEVRDEIKKKGGVEPTISFGIPNSIRPTMRNFVLEVVFVGFRNYIKSGLSSRHRIKIMMGDLLLTSGLSTAPLKHSINFLVLYASGVVVEYWPAVIATDVVVSAKGAETTIGAVLIPNSKRFLQKHKKLKSTVFKDNAVTSSVGSTSVHVDACDNDETLPLLKTPKRTLLSRLRGIFRKGGKKKNVPVTNPTQNTAFDVGGVINENSFNWWTKFYNSMYLGNSNEKHSLKHRLTIYHDELEKQPEFSYLRDWAEQVKLVHGGKFKKKTLSKEEVYATLKLHLKLTACQCGTGEGGDGAMLRPLAMALNPRYQEQLQSLAELCKVVARVYVVQGLQLRPRDKQSQSDAYVRLQLGSKSTCNRAHYVPNQSNPIFGKCFQLEGLLPREHMLEISVFDHNTISDDEIGTTFIDLEDRWRSQHRATVGIANEFSTSGYNKWRDLATPFEILTELCTKYDVKAPKFTGNTIEVENSVFHDETQIAKTEDLQERLSLTVLKNLEKITGFGFKLVPEHVETRSLYRGDCPGIEQGKIQLWLELYEGNLNLPPTIDITPQPPQTYELRVVIWDCEDVLLEEKNIFGKQKSDIFIKGWCQDPDEAQYTDIHYGSLNGEGSFNWRMIFPVKYSSTEDMMVIKRKSGLLEEYETKQPATLNLQIWDNDFISADDFIGAIEINLSNFSEPFEKAKHCMLDARDNTRARLPFGAPSESGRRPLNLFNQKVIRGWFPARGDAKHRISISKSQLHSGQHFLAGKIDLELAICSEAEAAASPAGLGRTAPQPLPEPARPVTSVNPLLRPIKSLKPIMLRMMRKFFFYSLIAGVCFGLIALVIYIIPLIWP